jgi:archaellum component FlaC
MVVDPATSLSWFFDHLHLAFWAAALAFVWRSSKSFNKYVETQEAIDARAEATEKMVLEVHGSVNTIRDNHLTHLAQDVKDVHATYEKQLQILQSIDKGISVLVDRSSNKRGK